MIKIILLLFLLLSCPFINALSLIGKWGFEEGSGTVAYNSSANMGINGSIANATYTTGRVGNYALDFNGSNSYVVFENPNDIFTPRTIGISLWFKARGSQVEYADILDKGHGAYSNPYYGGYVFQYNSTASSFSTIYGNGSNFYGANTGGNYKDDVWHHVVANLGETEISLYMDGVLISKTAGAGPLASNDSLLYLGRHRSVGRYFNGLIDEVQIYNGALSQNDITALYSLSDPLVPELSSCLFLGFSLILGYFGISRNP